VKPLILSSTEISETSLPYVIAEIGVNHENSIETAIKLIDEAKQGGASAAKFQTYKADLISMTESPAYWDQSEETAKTQHELFQRYDSFGLDQYTILSHHCREVGIDFMSTPFDLQAVESLDQLVDVFKIASADITNIPLLRKVGSTRKPVILSTGASNIDEIDRGLKELVQAGSSEVALLHCILNYPTDDENSNLLMISHLRDRYPDHWVGLSDHTRPSASHLNIAIAYSLGARIIEKHFTHDKSLPGNDHYHSMDVVDLKRMVEVLEHSRALLGSSTSKRALDSEEPARKFARRGICAAKDLPANHVLTESDLICLRPVSGIPAEFWDRVVGRTLVTPVTGSEGIQWNSLEGLRQNGQII
jgi:sialic acid synthase SpsE